MMTKSQFQERCFSCWFQRQLGELGGQLALRSQLIKSLWNKFRRTCLPIADFVALGCLTIVQSKALWEGGHACNAKWWIRNQICWIIFHVRWEEWLNCWLKLLNLPKSRHSVLSYCANLLLLGWILALKVMKVVRGRWKSWAERINFLLIIVNLFEGGIWLGENSFAGSACRRRTI